MVFVRMCGPINGKTLNWKLNCPVAFLPYKLVSSLSMRTLAECLFYQGRNTMNQIWTSLITLPVLGQLLMLRIYTERIHTSLWFLIVVVKRLLNSHTWWYTRHSINTTVPFDTRGRKGLQTCRLNLKNKGCICWHGNISGSYQFLKLCEVILLLQIGFDFDIYFTT